MDWTHLILDCFLPGFIGGAIPGVCYYIVGVREGYWNWRLQQRKDPEQQAVQDSLHKPE